MKTLLLCGNAAHQRALAHQLHGIHPLQAIAAVQPPRNSKRKLTSALAAATIGRPLGQAWRKMIRHYDRQYPDFPIQPTLHQGINSPGLIDYVRREAPDLVLVSGTELLRAPLIDAVSGRIMNLHTGISPYLKGAPNCTNWALALGEFGLIGNTVLWLDAGIDSGNIIATEQTPLSGDESLSELHLKVMDHAHDFYGRAYRRFVEGRSLPSVPQAEISEGRLFLTRNWTARRMLAAITNFYAAFGPANLRPDPQPILIDLD